MTYLIAKYTLLFLIAAILSFILGHWWSRRNFVDVSSSFEELRNAKNPDEGLWRRLWKRLDTLDGSIAPSVKQELSTMPQPEFPTVDLSGIERRLNDIESRFEKIPKPKNTDLSEVYSRLSALDATIGKIPKPEPVSFAPLDARFANIEKTIHAIPKPSDPKPVDLEPLGARIGKLEESVRGIPKPQPVNLGPLDARLGKLEETVRTMPRPAPVNLDPVSSRIDKVERAIKELPKPERPQAVDLQPVHQRLGLVEEALKGIPKVETHPPVDLNPLNARITELDRTVRGIPRPTPVDLNPVNTRLTGIEVELKSLKSKLERPQRVVREAPKQVRQAPTPKKSGPRLLNAASFGTKDDLKRISGVGPKLERLLNKNGVYYFWQVASWNQKDIDFIDARLDVFKGRIARDKWVTQAKQLRKETGAAREPAQESGAGRL